MVYPLHLHGQGWTMPFCVSIKEDDGDESKKKLVIMIKKEIMKKILNILWIM